MGYNLKATYCDLTNLVEGGIATVSAIFGEHTSEGQKTKGANVVDLNLGSLADFGEGRISSFRNHKAPLMEPLSAGSSKRARAPSSGGQTVSCLVDGCKSDLSKCRDYHRRHKVCEMHSKAPRVTIGGHEQRFCQQCSRFHSLGEFDEGKRSCRKRLEGHNRRRRKPQPEPLPVNHGNFLAAGQGDRYMSFSNQPVIPASAVVSTTWSGPVKAESNPALFSSSVSASYSQAYRGRQFPFLQGTDSPLPGASSVGQRLHHDHSSSGSSSSRNVNNINHGLNQVSDSDHRALSLLSSSPAETPEMGLGRIIQPSPINPARPIISNLFYNSIGQFPGPQGMEGQPGGSGSGLIPNMRSSNTLCQDVFRSEPDESSASGHQTLSFSWE